MKIKLSDHFSYRSLMRFVLPSIIMMTVSSVYGIVDGFFVSNFIGDRQFTALNFIMPVVMILGGLGFIVGTGGSALVAKILGEGNRKKANQVFSMLIYVTFFGGIVLSVLGILFIRPIALLIGAEKHFLEDCVVYARVLLIGNTAFMLQNAFQSFLVAAERPKLGLIVSVSSGVTNMFLDFLFIYLFKWGLVGAAAATVIGQVVGGIIPFGFFLSENNGSPLHLGGFYFNFKELRQAITNGISEFVSNISASVVGMIYNAQLLRYAGEAGVAAYGVLMYVNFIFLGFFFGYSVGASPVISFHYGAGNKREVRGLLKKSLTITGVAAVAMTLTAVVFARPLSLIFVSYNKDLLDMTVRAMTLYATSFLFFGLNVFASSFFTALNNGLLSAVISLCRTFVLQCGAVLLLPMLLEVDGIWLAVTVAESLTLILSAVLVLKSGKKYGYRKKDAFLSPELQRENGIGNG